MAKKPAYWFKAKSYGYGWSYPLTWQGWLTYGLFMSVLAVALFRWILPYEDQNLPSANIWKFVAVLAGDVTLLAWLGYKHGEPAKWRWGRKK